MSLFSHLSSQRQNEILGILLFFFGLLLSLSVFTYPQANLGGFIGKIISEWLLSFFGLIGYLVPFLFLILGWNRFGNQPTIRLWLNSFLFLGVLLTFCLFSFLFFSHLKILTTVLNYGFAGLLGNSLGNLVTKYFGSGGVYIFTFTLLLVTLLLTTEINFQSIFNLLKRTPKIKERKKGIKDKKELIKSAKAIEETVGVLSREEKKIVEISIPPILDENYSEEFLSLLHEPHREKLVEEEDKSAILSAKLKEFGVEGKVVGRSPGPVITRYEFEPAPGIKVSQVSNLSDDLALGMRALRIRIVAPIPGKGAVGIEIPNQHRSSVLLREILETETFQEWKEGLPLAIGKDISGEPFYADLTEMPHLLIAGATGSGKSVCLNTLINSLLFKSTPEKLHFIMVDPKRIELSIYRGIPHLQFEYSLGIEAAEASEEIKKIEGIVVDPLEVVKVFRMAVMEMENRYKLLAQAGSRNIEDYNAKNETKLSYLVIVIDELADIMLSREANEIEAHITKLAQMSRAVGIHLILATQRPSVDVITGLIKANFPARIAFQVASKTDSRTILDANGAEKLLGRGDMLFLPPGKAETIRVHGAFISTEETEKVVNFIKKWYGVTEESITEIKKEKDYALKVVAPSEEAQRIGERDELFEEAKRLVIRHQQGSVSLLQRRLGIGYARAARLIDQLEDAGIVGPFDGSKAREVLVGSSEYLPKQPDTNGEEESKN
ncbi:MAG: DNA translocase FtsK 4TM domain-containing protein [Candidatus Edwardsbacteria bacterium]